MKWNFFSNSKLIFLWAIIFSLIPLLTIFSKIWLGEFAFWYDPARDLLSAIDNVSKPTLIGPTTGIPGVFYGPYWIWLLSLGTLISRDPRIVTFIAVTIPYVIIFPFILSRFSSIIRPFVLALLWLLFLLGFNNYFTDLWNPHLAPLLILFTIYLLLSLSHGWSLKNVLVSFFAGFTMGIVMNFQLSLGIGMLLGVIIYFIAENIVYFIHEKKKQISILQTIVLLSVFFLGSIIAFTPYLLFEVRHQFFQTKTLLNAFLHYGGVVNLHGLSQNEILLQFLATLAKLLQLPVIITGVCLLVLFVFFAAFYKTKRIEIKNEECKLLLIIGSILIGIGVIYLTAKNPIWEYHFIGVEVLCLLLLGVLINRFLLVQKILAVWVIILLVMAALPFLSAVGRDHQSISGTLIAEQKVVEKIKNESGNANYTVFAYSPSIYTYEYSYLFKWMTKKDFSYRPELIPTGADTVFLIIPAKTVQSKEKDFINFRTPDSQYKTANQWELLDGTKIIKREKSSRK